MSDKNFTPNNDNATLTTNSKNDKHITRRSISKNHTAKTHDENDYYHINNYLMDSAAAMMSPYTT